jgi:hypothetical protein
MIFFLCFFEDIVMVYQTIEKIKKLTSILAATRIRNDARTLNGKSNRDPNCLSGSWDSEFHILGFLQPGFSRLPDHTPSVMWMGWRSVFCEAAGFLQIPYGRLF